ncbi:MAG: glycosyltransferase family 39 protein [Candidatus Eisenbacteria bacterium]|nr:glycosyltransferase family 39 protein [Candidatus Eisenbacteria bacterium]
MGVKWGESAGRRFLHEKGYAPPRILLTNLGVFHILAFGKIEVWTGNRALCSRQEAIAKADSSRSVQAEIGKNRAQVKPRKLSQFPYFVFLLALFLRVFYAASIGERIYWDDDNYLLWASRIVETGGRDVNTLVPPGQTLFLAGVELLPGSTVVNARLLQSLLGALTVLFLYFIGKILLGVTAARLSSFVAALYPFLVYISSALIPQCIFAFLLASAFVLLVLSGEKRRPSLLIPSGISFGLSALFVPLILPVMPAFALWLMISDRIRIRKRLVNVLILTVFTTLPVFLWGMRNYVVEGKFIPIARMGARAFFAANNPLATAEKTSMEERSKMFTPDMMQEIARSREGSAVADSVYMERTKRFVRENPQKFISLCAKRFVYFFDLYPSTFSKNPHTGKLYKAVSVVSFTPVLVFSLLGTLLLGRRWRKMFIVVLVPLLFALFHSFFTTSVRYRIPVEPYMILLASCGFLSLLAYFGFRSRDFS